MYKLFSVVPNFPSFFYVVSPHITKNHKTFPPYSSIQAILNTSDGLHQQQLTPRTGLKINPARFVITLLWRPLLRKTVVQQHY